MLWISDTGPLVVQPPLAYEPSSLLYLPVPSSSSSPEWRAQFTTDNPHPAPAPGGTACLTKTFLETYGGKSILWTKRTPRIRPWVKKHSPPSSFGVGVASSSRGGRIPASTLPSTLHSTPCPFYWLPCLSWSASEATKFRFGNHLAFELFDLISNLCMCMCFFLSAFIACIICLIYIFWVPVLSAWFIYLQFLYYLLDLSTYNTCIVYLIYLPLVSV